MTDRSRLIGKVEYRGILLGVADAFSLLTRREKTRAVLLVLAMNVNAALGIIGLAGILPFVQLMLAESPLDGDGMLARVLRQLNFTDINVVLMVVGIALIGMIMAKNAYALVHARIQNGFCAKAEARLATDLLDRVTRTPYAVLVTRNSSIVRDIVVGQSIEWSRGIIRPTLQAGNDLIFLLAVFGLLIYASPVAGMIVTLLAGVLAAALMMLSQPRIAFHAERKRRAIRLAGVTAAEAISGARDVRISGAGPMMVNSFADDVTRYATSDAAGRQWQLVPRLGIEVIGFAALVGIALGALWSGMPRVEAAGFLALYAVVAVRAIPMVSQLVVSLASLPGALPAVGEIRALIRQMPHDEAPANVVTLHKWRNLELKGVSFAYDVTTPPAVGPLDLNISRGRSFGVVGISGAGKSTLVDLIVGLLTPQTGEIQLDGRSLDAAMMSSWRKHIAYVAQTPFLIDASLSENITFGLDEAVDPHRMEEAITSAGLTNVVTGLPDGLETPLGERGVRLSGGQRQRVAIARALYRNADLIVMDEATSALDSLTEREITEELDGLKGRLTLIVVAHRLSTIARLDEIIVLEKGLIAARGSHEQLLKKSPDYRRLIEAQAFPV